MLSILNGDRILIRILLSVSNLAQLVPIGWRLRVRNKWRHVSIRFNKSQKKKTRERELFVLINELKLKKEQKKIEKI